VIVVSHRGPVSFGRSDGGGFTTRRGAGGVVSALGPQVRDRDDVTWIAAAMGDTDRAAIAAGARAGDGVELVAPDPELHRLHYEVITNRILWFLVHGLFDLPHEPVFDAATHEAWAAYRAVNEEFADRVADRAAPNDTVAIQDLHFLLVPGALRARRPDLAVTLFVHTPWCNAEDFRVLPEPIRAELVDALTATPVGFHTTRWADAARSCLPATTTYAATFSPDRDDLDRVAALDATAEARSHWQGVVGDRRCLVRCDRMELSKNIVRGFRAFDELLARRPEHRGRVVFVAVLNPSRESLVEYRDYRAEVERTAAEVNDRWGDRYWTPIVVDTRDDFPRSLAAMQIADALLVNPVRDGLNLVALESPLVNQRAAAVCLSPTAGAYDVLGDACVTVDPFDVSQTADGLHRALTMETDERAGRHRRLVEGATRFPAEDWLTTQLARAG
jgi:trehalose 6-phosphate synthase